MDWKIFGRAFGGAALKFATFAALAVTVSVLSHFWPVVTGIGLGLVLLAGLHGVFKSCVGSAASGSGSSIR